MAQTLTTNNIVSVGALDPMYASASEQEPDRAVVESDDSLLIYDASAQNNKKLPWGQVQAGIQAIETAAESAKGVAQAAADEAKGWANGGATQNPSLYASNNAKYFKEQADSSASAASGSAATSGNHALESEGFAKGTQSGTPVTSESPYYENNSKHFSLKSEGFAKGTQDGTAAVSGEPYFEDNAYYFKGQAALEALKSEGYANGKQNGVLQPSGTYFQNNSEYFKDQAETAATLAQAYAGSALVASGTIDQQKTITLSTASLAEKQVLKVIFPVGHNAASSSTNMTLNNIVVVSNQNGTLAPLPIHSMTENSATVYKVLGPNVCLEMYYTADYDGNSMPAFVIVGNPVVLSGSNYTIYADGKKVVELSAQTIISGPLRSISVNAGEFDWYGVTAPTIPSGKTVLRYAAEVQQNANENVRAIPMFYRGNSAMPDAVGIISDYTQTLAVCLVAVVI